MNITNQSSTLPAVAGRSFLAPLIGGVKRLLDRASKNMEEALVELLVKAAREFSGKELLVLDIGIFPWFNSIEVSFLFSEDECDSDDIAAWPHYDYSEFNEGGWLQAKPIAERLAREWEKDSNIVRILKREALVANLPRVREAISKFTLAKDFTVQVLNSDDSNSPNYCA